MKWNATAWSSFKTEASAFIAFNSIMSIVGIIGNSAILWKYPINGNVRKSGIFVKVLAFLDLCNCLLIPYSVMNELSLVQNEIACGIMEYIRHYFGSTAVLMLVMLAVERYMAICFPYISLTIRKHQIIIGTLFIIQIVFMIPVLFLTQVSTSRTYSSVKYFDMHINACYVDYSFNLFSTIVVLFGLIVFFGSASFMCVAYLIILRRLTIQIYKQKRVGIKIPVSTNQAMLSSNHNLELQVNNQNTQSKVKTQYSANRHRQSEITTSLGTHVSHPSTKSKRRSMLDNNYINKNIIALRNLSTSLQTSSMSTNPDIFHISGPTSIKSKNNQNQRNSKQRAPESNATSSRVAIDIKQHNEHSRARNNECYNIEIGQNKHVRQGRKKTNKQNKTQKSNNQNKSKSRNLKRSLRLVVMYFIVSLIFILSWTPYWLFRFRIIKYNVIFNYTFYINNCSNFFVYVMLNRVFHKVIFNRNVYCRND